MSLYSSQDERRIRAQALVREWTKSGLLDPAQGAALEAELRVDVRRTNVFLRAGLALFTALIVAASVLFIVQVLDLDRPIPGAVVTGGAAVVSLVLAHYLIVRHRFYRFGVEEMLAVGSVVLMAISAMALMTALNPSRPGDAVFAAAFVVGAAGGAGVYWRFGYVYAAIGTIACAAAVPFQVGLMPVAQHAVAAATCATAFVIARTLRARHQDDYPADDYALLQAAAWAGLYITLNLQVVRAPIEGPFYWFTYLAIWTLPLAGLFLAIRGKDRALLDVSLVMTLVTLLTNKPYLRLPRHEWDAILLGAFLMAAAIAVRRWLSTGPNGQRAGFTASRILSRETGAVTMMGTASARFHPDAPALPASSGEGFEGGRSGGGGATGSY